jgi:hypothetical protein
MLTFSTNEDCSVLPADCEVRLCPILEVPGEVVQVLDDASLLDVEAFRIGP